MKKLLLLGLILAICVLAMPQGVLAATQSPVVNANIAHTLTFTATSPGTWTMGRTGGVATDNLLSTGSTGPIPITVDSANKWEITAIDAKTGTNQGHMVPTGSPFAPTWATALVNPLQVQTGTTTFTALPETGTTAVSIKSGTSGYYPSLTEDLKQTVALSDYVLTSGTYQMTITLTLTET